LLQHRLLVFEPRADEKGLFVIQSLLQRADAADVWGLVPAFRPTVEAALRLNHPLLDDLRRIVSAKESPFRYSVFRMTRGQEAVDTLMGPGTPPSFGLAFLKLCDDWPYHILFVAPPYGRRGQRLSESNT
jgi:hypothetical protein